jgi:hypothetical protein
MEGYNSCLSICIDTPERNAVVSLNAIEDTDKRKGIYIDNAHPFYITLSDVFDHSEDRYCQYCKYNDIEACHFVV